MKTHDRKSDTRRKIQLGGLIIKAKLDHLPSSVLYGLLIESMEKLQANADEAQERWKLKGDLAFREIVDPDF